MKKISDEAMDILFRDARSHNGWLDKPVSDAQLHEAYALMKMGPTSANSCPARIVFVRSHTGKERLKPCMSEGNISKVMTAPVVAIIGMDMEFYEHLPRLFPHTDARSWYAGKPEKIVDTSFRNSSLQGAYFILAARSIGLDCGPMSGFDADKLAKEFFPDGRVKPNFICALGYGDTQFLFPRLPRFSFDEVCTII